jgi:NAD(P)-dependent dehydrogenase (short-subunit alcohol dehydrogenase family)
MVSARFTGKTAIVMGGGSAGPGWGNGKATAVALAEEGAWVAVVDLRLEAAEETAALIAERGGEGVAFACDATKSDRIAAVVQEVHRRRGRIDILHNNVGYPESGDPVELAEELWDQAMAVNVKSAFLACKHVLPIMEAQGGGAIVNTSSLAGIRFSGYNNCSYYASKAALNQFTAHLAMQYADKNIRVNAVLPGLMDTPLIYTRMKGRYDDVEEMLRDRHARVPMKRMGSGFDVAKAVMFLVSDDAEYITGVLLPVDGGLSCTSV